MKHLSCPSREDLSGYLVSRAGETRIGTVVALAGELSGDIGNRAGALCSAGVKYAMLGIPEDIGVRANFGRAGAHGAWDAFLSMFLNLPVNDMGEGLRRVGILGSVEVSDLLSQAEPASTDSLRLACARIDERVEEVLAPVFSSGLVPIVIGGGHNNALPILRSLRSVVNSLSCLNIDAHADLRPAEGRHSGNAFTYALAEGLLSWYGVFGIHERGINEDIHRSLSSDTCTFRSYEDLFVRSAGSDMEARFVSFLDEAMSRGEALGLELDLDVISNLPSSAMSPAGFSLREAARLVFLAGARANPRYLHLPEGAPSLGGEDGPRIVGRALVHLVGAFVASHGALT